MPLTDHYERLPLSSIIVLRDERQRKVVDTSDLDSSIRLHGVLSPILVRRSPEGGPVLVFGERRLEASRKLELPDIPARWVEDLSPVQYQVIELEENLKRKDLPWQDFTRSVAHIHRLYLQLDPDWTMTETGESLGMSLSRVSRTLRVERNLSDEKVQACSGIDAAINLLERRDARSMGDALEELLEVPLLGEVLPGVFAAPATADVSEKEKTILGDSRIFPPVSVTISPIACASFLDWAPQYSGQKFNLIHCDFPYGIGVFNGPQGRGAEPSSGYADTESTYFDLLECFCIHLDRFMSLSGHLMFWTSGEIMNPLSQYAKETWKMFQTLAPSLNFRPFPLIWIKSDNAGIASDPRHGPRHVYEVCLLASRSSRQIVRVVADAYSAPTDKRLHPSTKPEPMLRHFMTMLVDEHSRVFDPTAGSGAALRAADSLGAAGVFGLELDQDFADLANQAFRNVRLLRSASKEL